MKKSFIKNLSFILSVSGGLIFAQQKPNSVGINTATPSQTLDVAGTVRLEKPGNWVDNGKRLAITADGKVVTTDFPLSKITLLRSENIPPIPGKNTFVAQTAVKNSEGKPFTTGHGNLILSDAKLVYDNKTTRRPAAVGINATAVVQGKLENVKEKFLVPLKVNSQGILIGKEGDEGVTNNINNNRFFKRLRNKNFLTFPIVQKQINVVTSSNNEWQVSLGHPVASTIGRDRATWTISYIFVNKEGIKPLTYYGKPWITFYTMGLMDNVNGPHFSDGPLDLNN